MARINKMGKVKARLEAQQKVIEGEIQTHSNARGFVIAGILQTHLESLQTTLNIINMTK